MRELDFTNTRDIVFFVENYSAYKDSVNFPKSVTDEFQKLFSQYDEGFITSNEVRNQMIDIILNFIKAFGVTISWRDE